MLLVDETKKRFGYDPSKLSKGSNKSCLVECDYCGDVIEKKYFKWLKARKHVQEDSCAKQGCRLKKQEKNNLVKRGVKHHSQTKEYKEKFKQTCLDRYGVENPFQDVEKVKRGVMDKYGVDNISKLPEIQAKKQRTNYRKYGAEFLYQNKSILKRAHNKIFEKYGDTSYGKAMQRFTSEELQGFLDDKDYEFAEDTPYENRRQIFKIRCKKHNVIFTTNFVNLQRTGVSQCPECKPRSIGEREIYEFVSQYAYAIHNDRTQIYPNELDVYVPSKNLAIEYDGLYWHSELFRDEHYHYNKFKQCESKGIKLLSFYEDEWRDKRYICESMIKVNLGLADHRLFARKLVLKSGRDKRIKSFFDHAHLSGNTQYSHAFWLEQPDGTIVAALSFRKPFAKKAKNVVEIARFATAPNHIIVGGFTKLLTAAKKWAIISNYEGILTYSDCRYSNGSLYRHNGFDYDRHTGRSYGYTDFLDRYNRFKFRAQAGMTERQIAEENAVYRIFSSGNYCWQMSLER